MNEQVIIPAVIGGFVSGWITVTLLYPVYRAIEEWLFHRAEGVNMRKARQLARALKAEGHPYPNLTAFKAMRDGKLGKSTLIGDLETNIPMPQRQTTGYQPHGPAVPASSPPTGGSSAITPRSRPIDPNQT